MSLIVDDSKLYQARFNSLRVGAIFRDGEGDDCLKVRPSGYSGESFTNEPIEPNTVRLSDATLHTTPWGDWVTPYPTGTTITYKE